MISMPADLSLPSRVRALLARRGRSDVCRLSDFEAAKAARSLLASAVHLRDLEDLATAAAFFAQTPLSHRAELRGLFERAVDLLDFTAERDRGILYDGQYAETPAAESRIAVEIGEGAGEPGAIGTTSGGRWLQKWNLHFLLGGEAENAVWQRATKRFLRTLSGEVHVRLEYPAFNRVFRTLESHPLFGVAEVTRIVFRLTQGGSRMFNVDPALFGAGVVKRAHGKVVVFQAKRN